MSQKTPWLRIGAEGTAIVVSILLAFGIQAWWEGRGDRSDVNASLELLASDLHTTRAELARFVEQTSAGLERVASAAEALAGPTGAIDRARTSADIAQMARRRTVDLSSAAFTDLISTGTLGLIPDRELRDQIVEFYQQAAFVQAVLEKNTTLAADDLGTALIYGEGLLLTIGDEERLDDPIWALGPDSREWRRLRSVLQVYGAIGRASIENARRLGEQADDLHVALTEHLAR